MPVGSLSESKVMKKTKSSRTPARRIFWMGWAGSPSPLVEGSSVLNRGPIVPPKSTPLKVLDDLRLAFRVAGYPLEIEGSDSLASVSVRPEATVFVYSHAAFTVRQIVFAPLDEPGVVILLDIDSALPITVLGSFRPRLKLMWPAGLMTEFTMYPGPVADTTVVSVPPSTDISISYFAV